MPTVNKGKGVARHRSELWLEDSPGEKQSAGTCWKTITDVGGTGPFCRRVTIGTLPDDVLLEIFDFYVDEIESEDIDLDPLEPEGVAIEAWVTLVHVCQQWRYVMFASPCRLNLRLLCTRYHPVRNMLDVWPALPIAIRDSDARKLQMGGVDNVVAALEHNDRIYDITFLFDSNSLLEGYVAMMQVSFPALTSLFLVSFGKTASVLPDSFLGGSAPRLQSLKLIGILFPALRRLLLTTTDLVKLILWQVPHSGYISPSAMVTCLSSLNRLESLELGFHSPQSRPDRASRRPPPLTRTVLPSLTYLEFRGISEYLEDFVAEIDTPHLHKVDITFFSQLIFNTPRFRRFLSRTEPVGFPDRATLTFTSFSIEVGLSQPQGVVDDAEVKLRISCTELDWQLSSMAQVCNTSLPLFATLEHLYVHEGSYQSYSQPDDMESTQWVELFQPFTTVKNLYLSEEVTLRVAPALKELTGESVSELLPALQGLFLEGLQPLGPVQEAIKPFIAARQLSGQPIAVHRWERG